MGRARTPCPTSLTLGGISVVILTLVSPSMVAAWSSTTRAALFEAVHQIAIKNVLRDKITDADLKILTEAQSDVDTHQAAAESYLHAMTGIEDKGRDRNTEMLRYVGLADTFVRKHLGDGIARRKAGDDRGAFAELGQALHPLTDWSSPVHNVFLPWRYNEGVISITTHVFAERRYPTGTIYDVKTGDGRTNALRAELEGAVCWAYHIFTDKASFPKTFFNLTTGQLQLPPEYKTLGVCP
jgi:hypothetical protein